MGRLLSLVVLTLLAAACSFDWDHLDPELRGGGGEAAGASGGGGSAGAGGPGGAGGLGGMGGTPCPEGGAGGLAAQFGEVTLVEELAGSAADDDPVFSEDLLELYFNSNRNGVPFQIFRSTRACPTDPWGPPAEVAELNLAVESTTPALSPDGLTLFVAYSFDDIVKEFDIYRSTRASRDEAWSMPTLVSELSSSLTERVDWISADGLSIGIDSARAGGGDLFVATRASVDVVWDAPAPVSELNTAELEAEAWVSPDGLTTYFGREVMGRQGEIFRATRVDAGAPWSNVEAVDELNTDGDESDPWLSPDGRHIMFTRHVDGQAQLHQARR